MTPPSIEQFMDGLCMRHMGGYFEHQSAIDEKVLESDALWENGVSSKYSTRISISISISTRRRFVFIHDIDHAICSSHTIISCHLNYYH